MTGRVLWQGKSPSFWRADKTACTLPAVSQKLMSLRKGQVEQGDLFFIFSLASLATWLKARSKPQLQHGLR